MVSQEPAPLMLNSKLIERLVKLVKSVPALPHKIGPPGIMPPTLQKAFGNRQTNTTATNPRANPLLRGIHFELAVTSPRERAFFELQALTVARDAVGLLDHDTLYKPCVEPNTGEWPIWLNQLRIAANVFDYYNFRFEV